MTESSGITDDSNEGPMIPRELSDSITAELDELTGIRETALAATRKIIQLSSKVINGIHLGSATEGEMDRLGEAVEGLLSDLRDHPRICYAPYVDSAIAEYCEAAAFWAVVNGRNIPTHAELGVDPGPYLLGLGDAVGEIRRYVLGRLKDGDVEKARFFYGRMEGVYEFISGFHYPKAVVDIRRKRDVARSLLDRTLGELVVTSGNIELARRRTCGEENAGE